MSDLFGNDPRYASPEALARIADAPLSVCRLLFAAAEDDIDTLRLLRSGALDEDSVRMRQAVAFVAKLSVNCSLPEIGRTLNMDHSAVQRSVDAALDRLALDPEFTALVRRLKGLKLGMGRHPGKDGAGQKDAA